MPPPALRGARAGDQRGAAVDHLVPERAGVVVAGVAGAKHGTAVAGAEGDGGGGVELGGSEGGGSGHGDLTAGQGRRGNGSSAKDAMNDACRKLLVA